MEERIDIVISDKVAGGIAQKIRQIATESLAAENSVQKLKAQLASLNVSAFSQLQAAFDKSAAAQARAAISAQKLATEQERTALAANRAAQAALRLQQAQERAAKAGDSMAREADRLKAALYPAEAAQQAYSAEVQKALGLYKAGAINVKTYTDAVNAASNKLEAVKTGSNGAAQGIKATGESAKLSRSHLLNLGFQLQDIGVSLAGGQNPLMVMAQQGSQIAGIAGQAGVGMRGMAAAAAGMLVPFLPLVAAAAAVVGGLKLISSEAEKTAGLKSYAESLGLTAKQIKDLNADSVTFGDTLKGLWTTISEATGAGEFFSGIADSAVKAFKNILGAAGMAISGIVGLFAGAWAVIKELWARLPANMKKPIAEAINSMIGYLEAFANAGINAANKVIGALNTFTAVKIDPFKNVKFDTKVSTDFAAASGKDLTDVFTDASVSAMKGAQAKMNNGVKAWVSNTAKAARERVKSAADELGGKGGAGKSAGDKASKEAESRAQALQKVNVALDNEINRMNVLKPQRELAQRFDQIEQQLLTKNIQLRDRNTGALTEEGKAIMAKVTTLEKNKAVQSAMDAIYEQSVGVQTEYNAHIEASNRLLKMGAISAEFHAAQIQSATDKYKAATDPMFEFNKQLEEERKLLGYAGNELEIQQQLQQLQNKAIEKGLTLTAEQIAQAREQLTVQKELSRIQEAKNQIYSETTGARQTASAKVTAISQMQDGGDKSGQMSSALGGLGIDTSQMQIGIDAQLAVYQDYYARLDEMRIAFNMSDADYSNARVQIQEQENKLKMKSTANFLNATSGLMQSKVRGMFELGKAASIAQAVMNTYEGASKALAQGGIYGAAMAAVTVANGMVQVQNIRSQEMPGYKAGGYTGDFGTSQVAGVVHGQEFVANAEATAKYRGTLEAMNNGTYESAGGGGIAVNYNPTIQIDSRTDRAAIMSDVERINKRNNAELVDTLARRKLINA